MLIGLPGSGKSTFTKQYLKDNPDTVVISSDDLLMASGLSYKEAFDTLYDDIQKQVNANYLAAIKDNKDIILDRTNLSKKQRNKFLCKLTKDYQKIAILFQVSDEILFERLDARNIAESETGKYISKTLIQSMKDSFVPPDMSEFNQISYQ